MVNLIYHLNIFKEVKSKLIKIDIFKIFLRMINILNINLWILKKNNKFKIQISYKIK
jgi:hypothetical protein